MKLLGLIATASVTASRFKRDTTCGTSDGPFQGVCRFNTDEASCTSGKLCCWDGANCNAKVADEKGAAKLENCSIGDGASDLGSCLLNDANFTANLAERRDLNENEQQLFTSTMGKMADEDDNSDGAKSGLLKMMVASNMMSGNSMSMDSMINPAMMGVTQLIDSKYFTCPVNVPHCQRMQCMGAPGSNPESNANDCFAIPGCCFDTKVYQYKYMLGQNSIPAPTCYKAIRTPIFHYFASQLTTNGAFIPNFLTFIHSKVEELIENDTMFDYLANQHRCMPTGGISPARIALEQYIMRAWPGYNMIRFMQKGFDNNDFLSQLVDSLSTQCGWKTISRNECMMFGCCYNKQTGFCSNPTDITKIPPDQLSKIIQNLMMSGLMDNDKKEETPKDDTTSLGVGALPIGDGKSTGGSGLSLTAGKLPTGEHSGGIGMSGSLFDQLSGRKRRQAEEFADISGLNDGARFGMMNPMMAQMGGMNPMMGNPMGGNPMMNMIGGQGPLLPSMPTGTGDAKTNPFSMLMGGLNGLSSNLFGGNGNMQTCNVPRKLDCMAAPDTLDSSEIWKMNQKCSIKGCCWDHQKAQQMVLGSKLDSLSSMMMMQCPYKVIAKIPGMPDLTADAEGCCEVSPCVHVAPPAEWTNWAEWSQCTAPCGGGVSVRSRSCEGHGFCPGMVGDSREQIIEQRCNTNMCEAWAEWSQYGPCSTTCGQGEHTRSRSCFSYRENRMIDSAPGCMGANFDTKPCQNQRCPTWSTWSQWNACPQTCGLGRQMRSRSCMYGMACPGSSQEFTTCGASCWMEWSAWSACSATCMGGQRSRSRDCNYIAEVGQQCIGNSMETEKCAVGFCEVWTSWQAWSACVGNLGQVCGNGSRSRLRGCTGVIGEPGCRGNTIEEGMCSLGTCQWSEWSQASVCETVKPGCGVGSATYTRSCNGGPGMCPGASSQKKMCELEACPGFSEWAEWTACSVTCGSGVRSRSRTCNGQLNIDCLGSTEHKAQCTETPCPNSWGQANTGNNAWGGNSWNTGNTVNTGGNSWGSSSWNSASNTGNSWNQPQPTQAPTQNTGGGMFGGLFGGLNTGNNFFQPNQGNNLFQGGQQNANPFQYIFG